MTELFVIDASVAAKWVLAEADTSAANELLLSDRHRLLAPASIRVEVAGAILRQYRTDRLTRDLARAACDRWDALVEDAFVRVLPIDGLYDTAVDLAFQARHALPDCFYLAAAQQLGATLVTADRTLFERGQQVHDRVRLLAKAA